MSTSTLVAADTKESNPKDLLGTTKLPLHLFPKTAVAQGSLAFLDGALKYGRSNFRVVGVRASVYYAALCRHMDAWLEGEDKAEDSQLSHLAHALACVAILIDAEAAGKLIDDRQVAGGYAKLVKELTPDVARLIETHKGKSPRHYTIQDSV